MSDERSSPELRKAPASHVRAAARGATLLLAAIVLGCAGRAGPPAIATGTPCARCGMAVGDRRFACERRHQGRWLVYDSIECLLADRPAGDEAYLTDYDGGRLLPADSAWVVRADVPSPMGGGYAAFADRAAADEVATARRGRVAHWSGWFAEGSVSR